MVFLFMWTVHKASVNMFGKSKVSSLFGAHFLQVLSMHVHLEAGDDDREPSLLDWLRRRCGVGHQISVESRFMDDYLFLSTRQQKFSQPCIHFKTGIGVGYEENSRTD